MAIESTMLPLGTSLPAFRLTNAVDGNVLDSTELKAPNGVFAMFICNHCPYVVHVRSELIRFAKEVQANGLDVVAINSNSTRSHPQDGPSHMKELATREAWGFAFLFDESQDVAKAFKAACTPDLFLFDGQHQLVYRGQFDDSRPKNDKPVTGKDLRAAFEALLAKRPPLIEQRASMGCGIKWNEGNAPAYLRAAL